MAKRDIGVRRVEIWKRRQADEVKRKGVTRRERESAKTSKKIMMRRKNEKKKNCN